MEWLPFSDEIEKVFTEKELEKAPLIEPEPFKPQVEWTLNQLDDKQEELLAQCMARIADKVSDLFIEEGF